MGPRSRFGAFGFRRSLPACEAVRLEVGIIPIVLRPAVSKTFNFGFVSAFIPPLLVRRTLPCS